MVFINTYYIIENNNIKFIDKLKCFTRKDNKILVNFDLNRFNIRKTKKILKILNKHSVKNVVLSKETQKNEILINYLNSNNVNIFNGRWLEKYLAYEIIKYILVKKNIKKEETEIAILINQIDEVSTENIKLFAKEFKRVNVVTNHIEKLKKIEENIFDEFGIMITITNNKKKSLKNAKIILNMDFPEELINKFNIYDEAIILNLDGNAKINKKRFSGLNINNYEIALNDDDYLSEEFYIRDIFESQIYKKTTFKNIRKEIKEKGVNIEQLIGVNGLIKLN